MISERGENRIVRLPDNLIRLSDWTVTLPVAPFAVNSHREEFCSQRSDEKKHYRTPVAGEPSGEGERQSDDAWENT